LAQWNRPHTFFRSHTSCRNPKPDTWFAISARHLDSRPALRNFYAAISYHIPYLRLYLGNIALHIECRLRFVVMLAIQDFTETSNRVTEWYILTRNTGKLLTNEEWLCQEALDLTSTRNCKLILIRQLFHTKDG